MKAILSLLLSVFIQMSSLFGTVSYIDTSNNDVSIYDDDEIVSVIVELKDSPLLEGVKTTAQKNKLINNFYESDAYKSLVSAQSAAKAKIQSKFKAADFSSSYSYSFILNGFSLQIPFKYVEKLKSVKGVKDVTISPQYDRPSTVDLSIDDVISSVSKKAMYDEGQFTGVNDAQNAGFTGKGMVIAVLDTSFELGHEAFAKDVPSPKLTKSKVNLISTFKCLNTIVPMYNHYISSKIPYRWDYSEVNKGVYSPNSDHGSHVAGIIGGNSDTLTGVAPDCQLLMMKVFKDAANSKAEGYVTMAALDDAVKLGADACNLSLSSPSGQTPDDPFTAAIYKRLERAGISVICSAGNEASMGENDATPGYDTISADLFDYGTVGSPSTYEWSMSVASSQIYSRVSSYPEAINVNKVGSQMMSSFSGWGVTADLRMKPEITAPGSNIYSSVSGNSYQYMSGTSMSSPYYAGCYALAKQYISAKYPKLDKKQTAEMINSILMSTAKEFRAYGASAVYSPRQQGAGLVNVNSALNTKTYLTTTSGTRPKLELGEDTDGTLKLNFVLNNMSNENLTYKLSLLPLTDSYKISNGAYINTLKAQKLTAKDYTIKYISGIDDEGNVTVHPNSKQEISLEVTFSEDIINQQKMAFKNGFFFDGYVQLTSETEPALSIPYVSFFGDWSKNMLFDNSMYSGTPSYLGKQWGLFVTDGKKYYPLGGNIFEKATEYDIDLKYCAYSKNALKSELSNPEVTACVGLLRNGKRVDFNLFTQSGIFRFCGSTLLEYERKTNDPSHPVTGKLWKAKGGLVNGQSYVYKVSTTPANYNAGRQTIAFDFVVDNDAPSINDVSYEIVNGEYILKLSISDNRYVMGFRVTADNGRTIGEVSFKGVDPVDGKYDYEMNVTKLAGNRINKLDLNNISIYALDYAYNEVYSTVTLSQDAVEQEVPSDFSLAPAYNFVPSATVDLTPADEQVNYGIFDKIIKKLQSKIEKYDK